MQENAGKNHSEVSKQIKANQDLNTTQQSVIQNHIIEFNDLKEMVKNQSVIQMKIQAQIANLHPPISHHGSFLLI